MRLDRDRLEEVTYFYLVKREPYKIVARRYGCTPGYVRNAVRKTMTRLGCPPLRPGAGQRQEHRQIFLQAFN